MKSAAEPVPVPPLGDPARSPARFVADATIVSPLVATQTFSVMHYAYRVGGERLSPSVRSSIGRTLFRIFTHVRESAHACTIFTRRQRIR